MTIELPNTAVFEHRKTYVRSYCLSVDPCLAPDCDVARGSTTQTSTDPSTSTSRLRRIRWITEKDNPNLRSGLTEYLMRVGIKTARASAEQQRTALLSSRRPW
jgi:hypothetical protein